MSMLKTLQIFDDLSTLRLDDTDLTAGVSEVLAHVPVRKPNRHEFFRVHPDEAYTLDTTVLIDKEDGGEAYLVTPPCEQLWSAKPARCSSPQPSRAKGPF
jgi:hypothetical protein